MVSRTAVRAPATGRDALAARIRALPHVVGVHEVGPCATRRFLVRFERVASLTLFVPAALKPVRRDPTAMRDVDRWVRTKARRIIFVYGGDDPWSAEPFECGSGAARRGCATYVVPGGNHVAKVADLPRAQRHQVRDRLRRWAGLR